MTRDPDNSALGRLRDPAVRRVLVRQCLAGALGGVIVFFLLEPLRISAGFSGSDIFDGIHDRLLPGILFGGIVTAFLLAAEELASGSAARVVRRTWAALVVGGVLGAGYSIIGSGVQAASRGMFPEGLGGELLARALGWACFGLGVGLSAGILSNSGRRSYQGCLGGVLGGFAGGIVFEAINGIPFIASLGLLLGLAAIGGMVGIATALIEQLSKGAWLTFLTGAKEGRTVILHRDEVVLGRDETVDVPLFGDPRVARRHAVLTLTPAPAIREEDASRLLRVDGYPVPGAALRDGAVVELGSHRFRFHYASWMFSNAGSAPPISRVLNRMLADDPVPPPAPYPAAPYGSPAYPSSPYTAGAYPAGPGPGYAPAPYPGPLPPGISNTGAVAPYPPAAFPAGMSSDQTVAMDPFNAGMLLRIISGPAAGTVVPVTAAGVAMGRDATSGLPVPDSRVSRLHARIDPVDDAWVLTDLGSTNGTLLNGVRITRAGLAPGDQVTVGDTVISVEAPAGAGFSGGYSAGGA